MSNAELLECHRWLLQTTHSLMAEHHEQELLTAITDAFVQLTGGEQAVLFLSEAGPADLVALCARGRGGLQATAPEPRAQASARRAFVASDASRVVLEGDKGRGTAMVKLFEGSEPRGVVLAYGSLTPTWSDPGMLAAFGKSASLALATVRRMSRASNDLLTGLPNSSALMHAVDKALREPRHGNAFGLLLLDLDAFKRVNSAAGADAGDRALVDVAHTLRDALCTDGLVSRFGSDKFAVLLPTGAREQVHLRLRDVAERARAAVGTKIYGGVQLSCSIAGIAAASSSPQPTRSAREVVSACDQVLTKLRRLGPGNIDIVVSLPQA